MRRKNRSAKMKSELGQSVDHFKRAASIAAQETSATVGPKFYAARDRVQPTAVKAKDAASSSWESALATLTPLVSAATVKAQQVSNSTAKVSRKDVKAAKKDAKKNARKLEKRANKTLGRKQKSRSGAKLGGLLLAGAAVGAVGAFAVRKRRQEQWDEYDPTPITPATTRTTGTDDATFAPADLSGPTGIVKPVDETAPAVEVNVDTADQTSSAQHTPKVAKMASGSGSGQNNKN
ncbi:hypothetical protein [Actinoplanes sp. NPDC049599]|uniref:hypothetical protein n=1 Tax=Actinoplanes sp. NPDC049599 TaxID=3363903 RepID=UPI0037B00BF9